MGAVIVGLHFEGAVRGSLEGSRGARALVYDDTITELPVHHLGGLPFATRNVMRAQDRLPADVRTSMGDQEAVKALRDIFEHYDEVDGRSFRTLAAGFPNANAEAFAHTNNEIWLGGLEGVPLSRVRAWLYRIRVALVAALAATGWLGPRHLRRKVVPAHRL